VPALVERGVPGFCTMPSIVTPPNVRRTCRISSSMRCCFGSSFRLAAPRASSSRAVVHTSKPRGRRPPRGRAPPRPRTSSPAPAPGVPSPPSASPRGRGARAGKARVAPLRCTKPRRLRAVGEHERLLLHQVVADLVVDLALGRRRPRAGPPAPRARSRGGWRSRSWRRCCGRPSTRGRAARRRGATPPAGASARARAGPRALEEECSAVCQP
jgi:hypothetical protein